jgi:hypothetical protein
VRVFQSFGQEPDPEGCGFSHPCLFRAPNSEVSIQPYCIPCSDGMKNQNSSGVDLWPFMILLGDYIFSQNIN